MRSSVGLAPFRSQRLLCSSFPRGCGGGAFVRNVSTMGCSQAGGWVELVQPSVVFKDFFDVCLNFF